MKTFKARILPLPGGGGADLLRHARTPSSLLLGAAAVGVVANALALAAPLQSETAPTRLGTSLQDSMAQRDRTLAEEKRKLEMREQAAKAGEARLAAEMRARQGQPNGADPLRAGAVEPNQPYDDLARIYQTMKPVRAAPIFEKLDLEVQTQVARRMRERSAALLMAAMSPNAAAELTMSLAGRKVIQRPQPVIRAASSRSRTSPAGGPPIAGK